MSYLSDEQFFEIAFSTLKENGDLFLTMSDEFLEDHIDWCSKELSDIEIIDELKDYTSLKREVSQYQEIANDYQQDFNEARAENATLKDREKKLVNALRISANQLEGVALAIKVHGQNINTEFFIKTHAQSARDAREVLKELGVE